MKITVQIVIEHEVLTEPVTEEIVCLCRGDLVPENLGLTLDEGKSLLAKIQKNMVVQQVAPISQPNDLALNVLGGEATKGLMRSFGDLCLVP